MAIAATSQTVYDGERNVTIKLTGLCDGTGNDEVDELKVLSSALSPPGGKLKIKKITYTVAYGAVRLSWKAAVPLEFALLDGVGSFDFCKMGGLPVGADPETANGDILLSTLGFDLNSSYTITLEMKKS